MDYLELILTFHQKYSKRWYKINDVLFFRFLTGSLLLVMFIVIYLANNNYDKNDIHRMIGDRYIEYIVGLADNYQNKTFNDIELYDTSPKAESGKAKKNSKGKGSAKGDQSTVKKYNGLLIDAENFETLSYNVEGIIPPTRFYKQSNKHNSGSFDDGKGRLLALDDYKIYRNAAIYLDVPEYLLEEKTHYVYRDQEDILKVIYSKSGIIESCYQKAARNNYVQPGFVKVEFQIAANGYVLPASIKILDSTIRNKEVEQCIKKNIRRWRNFEKLDDSEAIAHVVHKFVFN